MLVYRGPVALPCPRTALSLHTSCPKTTPAGPEIVHSGLGPRGHEARSQVTLRSIAGKMLGCNAYDMTRNEWRPPSLNDTIYRPAQT